PGASFPTLLVLEEAHHYFREFTGEAGDGSPLAYERLAKEGRKYNLSMLVSTQRPSELSPTVVARFGTWAVFRLRNEEDERAVWVASEWGEKHLVSQIPGLPRGQAAVFGAACSLPLRVSVIRREKE